MDGGWSRRSCFRALVAFIQLQTGPDSKAGNRLSSLEPERMNSPHAPTIYAPKKWNLAALKGISDGTLEMHFGLYEGYVKNTNLLNERLSEIRKGGQGSGANPAYAELVRRLGFEYNGMRLHEYYFDNMTKTPSEIGTGGL